VARTTYAGTVCVRFPWVWCIRQTSWRDYSFRQQLGDLEAIVQTLDLGKVILVAHDSSGIAAVNFAVEHPHKVESLCILNSAYDDSPVNVWPEMIVPFADPTLAALAGAFAGSGEQLGWLLD